MIPLGMVRQYRRRFAMAAALLFSLLFVFTGRAAEAPETPLTLRIADTDGRQLTQSGEEDALREALYDRFRILLEPVKVPAVDAGSTYRLWAATGNLPDLFVHDSNWDFYYFINCDALTPLPDDLYQYPHLKALVAYPYARTIQYGGKLWGIPRSLYAEEKRAFGSCVIMHADLYDSLGLESPPTVLADFADMLRRVRAQSPGIIPLTSYTPEAMFDLVYYEAPYRDTWIWNGTRYEPGFLTQTYCDSIARLSPLWREGLLDPDFMVSAGNPTGMDKFILRQAAAMVYTSSPYEWLGELAVRWQRLYPETPLSEGVRLLFLPGDANGAYHAPKVANSSMLYLSANMDESKLRRVLSLLDYLYSAEGKRLRRYGLEGEDYVLDEKGEVQRLPDASGQLVSLYEKYPSYALIRTLPDLDLGFTGRDKTMDEQVSLLLSQYWNWYDGLDMQEIYTTSLICNTTSTPSGEGFNPRITHNAFRMLCAQEGVEAMFEQIKEEYRQQGLERIINEVNWSAKIP